MRMIQSVKKTGFSTRPEKRDTVKQGGAVAIIVAIAIPVLIGFAGLALDLGKLFITKTELQNSADACALAAAQALVGEAGQLKRAEATGIATGKINRVIFQSEPVSFAENKSVTFSPTLEGSNYLNKENVGVANELLIKYARCTVDRTGIANWFMQVLNLLPDVNIVDQTVAATAVATTTSAQTNCALPVAICEEKLNTLKPGDWIAGALNPTAANKGSFRWVDLNDKGGGAREIKDVLSKTGVCDIPSIGTPIKLKPGNNNGVNDAWNTRFGLYKGAYKGPSDGVPDFTGYAYTPSSWATEFPSITPPNNAYQHFKNPRREPNYDPYQGDVKTGLDIKAAPSTKDVHSKGADRRINLLPVVNCTKFDAVKEAPLTKLACVLLLHPIGNQKKSDPVWSIPGEPPIDGVKMYLEYIAPSNAPSSPCVTVGVPGSPDGAGPKVPVLVQ